MIVPGIRFVQGVNDYTDRDGVKYGIAIHNTSNSATDSGEASYATWRPDGTSSHFYCDADSVTQSLDTDDKAGHAGSSIGNENAIAVEVTGTNDKSRAWWLANVAWGELGRVLAIVIRHHWPDGSFKVRRASVAEMKANPKVKAFYAHDDMRLAWGGTTHTDPGPGFPWDKLFAAVNAALEGDDDMQTTDRIGLPQVEGNTQGDASVGDALAYSLVRGKVTLEVAKRIEAGQAAILAAIKGDADAEQIIAEIRAQAAAEADARAQEQTALLASTVAALTPLLGQTNVTVEMLEEAFRRALGSLDGATPAA